MPANLCVYSTAQMQVDGLGRMPVPALEYLRTNAGEEYASVQHEYNMMVHVTSSNQQVESCMS